MSFSIHGDVELDQSLPTEPTKLKHPIGSHEAKMTEVIDRQIRACSSATEPERTECRGDREPGVSRKDRQPSQPRNDHRQSNGRGAVHHSNGNHTRGNGSTSGAGAGAGGGMTESQRRAIDSIAARLAINAREECRHEFGLELDTLTVREASRFIDQLKSQPPAPAAPAAGGNG